MNLRLLRREIRWQRLLREATFCDVYLKPDTHPPEESEDAVVIVEDETDRSAIDSEQNL